MKNILIPTDFTIRSLKLITAAINHFKEHQLQIHLIHALEPDDSISGLLFMNKRLNVHSLYDDTFLQSCEMIKNRYASTLVRINIEFYFGSSNSYKNNYMNERKIDAVILPIDYQFENCSTTNSVSPIKLWKNVNVPVVHVTMPEYKPALQSMASLLHS